MNKLSFVILMVSALLLGCKKDINKDDNSSIKNNVKFQLEFAEELEMFQLKSAQSVDEDLFLISIMDKDSSFVFEKQPLSKFRNGVYLEIGEYTAFAEYGDFSKTFGWDTPLYKGKSSFTVEEGIVSKVQLTVSLANTKVKVVYTDFLLSVYPGISIDVCANDSLDCNNYSVNNSKIGYYSNAESFAIHIAPTPDTIITHKISGVKPNMFYRLTFKANNQGADFSIDIKEEELIDIEYNVPIKPGDVLPGGEGDPTDTIKGKTFDGNINLVSQASIDNFTAQGFEIVTGNLSVNGSDLNTTALDKLLQVKGNLTISGTCNLSGFRNLKEVRGNFTISGGVHNSVNFQSLYKIGGNASFSGSLEDANLYGFERLNEIGGNLTITFGGGLKTMKGLNSLSKIDGKFTVIPTNKYNDSSTTGYDTYARNFVDLSSIKHIGWLTIGSSAKPDNNSHYYSHQFLNLQGLENLIYLNGFTVTRPKARRYNTYLYQYIKDYCAVPVEVWQNMPASNYSNLSNGYVPPLTSLQQGICVQ